eukprot:m.68774 g.68774  ORF g.68774 m.68774 type:complete len:116 (-) comp8257_c0_seq4:71-418(-)
MEAYSISRMQVHSDLHKKCRIFSLASSSNGEWLYSADQYKVVGSALSMEDDERSVVVEFSTPSKSTHVHHIIRCHPQDPTCFASVGKENKSLHFVSDGRLVTVTITITKWHFLLF